MNSKGEEKTMKFIKRILSVMLACMMLLSMIPFYGSADTELLATNQHDDTEVSLFATAGWDTAQYAEGNKIKVYVKIALF